MPTCKPGIDCIILAAGNASRFGGCKLLETICGEPLINRTLNAVFGANCTETPIRSVRVISGAYTEALASCFHHARPGTEDLPVELIHYPDWTLGMGSSLAHGVRFLPDVEAIMVILADQAMITASDLRQLYKCWHDCPSKIACASYSGITGVPAVFPRAYRNSLERLEGQPGARQLLKNGDTVPVPMPNAAIDIDTPDDLLHLRELLNNASLK